MIHIKACSQGHHLGGGGMEVNGLPRIYDFYDDDATACSIFVTLFMCHGRVVRCVRVLLSRFYGL